MTGGRCARCAGTEGVHTVELRSDGLAVVSGRLCARCDASVRDAIRRVLIPDHISA